MHIDWETLVAVVVVAAAAALTVVLLVAFALVAVARVPGPEGRGTPGRRPAAWAAVAVLCVLAAGLIVCYGLYLIVA